MSSTTELSFEGVEDLFQLAEDMFVSSVRITQEDIRKPSGMILNMHTGPVKFLAGKGRELEDGVHLAWVARQLVYKEEDVSRNALAFMSGMVWGFYRDYERVHALWQAPLTDEAFCGLDVETINSCVDRILEKAHDRIFDTDDSRGMACWMTGCMVGDYQLTTARMFEGMQ